MSVTLEEFKNIVEKYRELRSLGWSTFDSLKRLNLGVNICCRKFDTECGQEFNIITDKYLFDGSNIYEKIND